MAVLVISGKKKTKENIMMHTSRHVTHLCVGCHYVTVLRDRDNVVAFAVIDTLLFLNIPPPVNDFRQIVQNPQF